MDMIETMMPDGVAGLDALFARQQARAIALRSSGAEARIAKLRALEAAVQAWRPRLYAALQEDLGKPEAEADLSEILPVLSEIRHARRHLKSWMKPQRAAPTLTTFGTRARIRHEARGVCLIISPWNYPVNLALGPLASAIAAGNTAILKPSEMAPATSAALAAMLAEIFAPDEVAVREGDAAVATALLDLPFDHIFFTGSPAIGKVVMTAAARHLSSVTLELGGKSPVIVDAGADLAKAAKAIAWGKFTNCGQTCIAPDHLYAHEAVHDELVRRVRAETARMYGAAPGADYGRIVNERHFDRILRLLDDARGRGATVEGGAADRARRLIAPAFVSGAPRESAVMQEEIFGPVLPVIRFRDAAEPIEAINAAPKPLALYLFARDRRFTDRVIGETSSGGVGINTTMLHFLHGNLPFGGVNNSGIGNAHGFYGFRAFSHERAVLRDVASATPMLFPPYTKRVRMMVKSVLRLA
ncbi:aldehyde dehydrogenase family protein [Acidiphilium multivorum]|uniref:aldehyde dehydrogenase family protein n=1 Tax=Acidiphilium multivorum TaxID=62140 RepID=UPI001F4C4CBE|nr:aldehyde dehydrogenase family protein [Acidiphilium multivorum]UNC15478.1 aldehyde dehydrogenase family protein [Acidiphilium multivorum]